MLYRQWLTRKIVASGVRPRDVPMAFGMFIFVKWSLYMGGLGLCIRYHPLRRLANLDLSRRLLGRIRQKYPKRYENIEQKTFEAAENIAQSPYFRPLPIWLRVEPKHFVYSLVCSQFCTIDIYNFPHLTFQNATLRPRTQFCTRFCFQYMPPPRSTLSPRV